MSRKNPQAFYYPNLSFAARVRVLDGDEVWASNDLGAVCDDNNHFIDYEYLTSIMGKEEVDNAILPTHYTLLTGTRTEPGNIVKGMIEYVEVAIRCGTETFAKWRTFTLPTVLVVDTLPVPIHISLQALHVYPEYQQERLQVNLFPPKFHSHPYWNEQLRKQTQYVGINLNSKK